MDRKVLIILFVSSCILFISCKEKKRVQEIEAILTEWTGKTIQFPEDVSCFSMNEEVECMDILNFSYKILLYVDSIGCASCNLKLYQWVDMMAEIDSLIPEKVGFVFYFHPKEEKALTSFFRTNRFKHPVFVDRENKINQLNNFPDKMSYQCFLLNHENQVLSIGNPALNLVIWELYKKIIQEEEKEEEKIMTTVSVPEHIVEIEGMEMHQPITIKFRIENTGVNPLVIKRVETSCGCTVPSWEKRPIKYRETTEIEVEITPDEIGYFQKSINVYYNGEDGVTPLIVKGFVK